jgi:membrane associated rhomboid family serine protease
MRVDPLCTVIRFAPIGFLFAVHCSEGHWPTDGECAERVIRHGFSVDLFHERPSSIFTHLFVHISSQHLLSNVCTFASTLVEFGDTPNDSHDEEVGVDDVNPSPASRRHGSVASQMRALWGEHSPLQACLRTVGAFTVWSLGGAVGGLGGQLLYNDSTVALRRERATRASLAVRAAQQATATEGGGAVGQVLSTLSRHATVLRQRMEAFNSSVAANVQAAVNDAMLMCGASAGICALSGFNAVYYRRPVTAFCLVVPEVMALSIDLVNHYMALLRPDAASTGNPGLDAQRKALQSTWRTLMPGQTVGHAAHVGGFLAGAGIGYAWLWVQKCRLRRAHARRQVRK